MAEKEINEALFTLRREVEQLEDSNPALKDKLEELLNELEDRLEASEDENNLHLVEDFKAALSEFELEHPTATGVLNELMVTLGNLGI
jgi:phytoene/squalene synthetase